METNKAVPAAKPVVTDVVTFDATKAAVAGTPNHMRDRKANRIAFVKSFLSTPITFISQLGAFAAVLAEGKRIDVGGHIASTANPNSLRCVFCGGVHGLPTKQRQREGLGWNVERLALTSFWKQGNKVFPVSDTCVIDYILEHGRDKVTNLADVLKVYAGVGKKNGQ